MEASQVPSRVVLVAAALSLRCLNPQVAAHNRQRRAKSDRSRRFWASVVRALYRHPHCHTDYEIAVRERIAIARAALEAA